jgi:hypothetical protein
MRGSQFDLASKVDRAALEAVRQAIAHGKMINVISPSVAIFLAAFGRLDRFDPRLMYLLVLLGIFWPVSIAGRYEKGRWPESYAMAIAQRMGADEKKVRQS